MVSNSMKVRVAWALLAVGIVLALANWYTKPQSALAWAFALALFVVMAAALRWSRVAVSRWTIEGNAARGVEQITTAVIFAALMMGIPLALTLARAIGYVDSFDVARRSTGVLTSLFLVMIGNVMPKNLPPLSSGCDGARQQAFQRRAGWTWVLCGVVSALGWMTLPIDLAEVAAVALVVTAITVTIAHLVLLVRRARPNPPAA